MPPHACLVAGNTAVITGASLGGIGYSVALLLLQRYQMKVLLADLDKEALARTSDALIAAGVAEESFITHVTDVTKWEEVKELADVAFAELGRVDFLHLNAGTSVPTKDWGGDVENWRKILDVNLYGVLHGTQAFCDRMIAQGSPGAVVVTGSKQGITAPPGNPAYNVSKAVPYWGGKSASDLSNEKKPAAAWTPDQVAEELFARISNEFYIICPDNDVDWALDSARMEWNMQDILQKRPALSRWHPEYEKEFAEFVKIKTGK